VNSRAGLNGPALFCLFQSQIFNPRCRLDLRICESLNKAFLIGGIWKEEDFFLKSTTVLFDKTCLIRIGNHRFPPLNFLTLGRQGKKALQLTM
jgi:hypothetical protein